MGDLRPHDRGGPRVAQAPLAVRASLGPVLADAAKPAGPLGGDARCDQPSDLGSGV